MCVEGCECARLADGVAVAESVLTCLRRRGVRERALAFSSLGGPTFPGATRTLFESRVYMHAPWGGDLGRRFLKKRQVCKRAW